ncbi:MAG: hypothetical protein JO246_12715 [Frankiaceae bacterium]|nr:hypothetical protein [Frankiaceae bacterium]MBV9872381.1 hypothetical protein [Frankiaceae bacterium]
MATAAESRVRSADRLRVTFRHGLGKGDLSLGLLDDVIGDLLSLLVLIGLLHQDPTTGGDRFEIRDDFGDRPELREIMLYNDMLRRMLRSNPRRRIAERDIRLATHSMGQRATLRSLSYNSPLEVLLYISTTFGVTAGVAHGVMRLVQHYGVTRMDHARSKFVSKQYQILDSRAEEVLRPYFEALSFKPADAGDELKARSMRALGRIQKAELASRDEDDS